MGHAYTRSVHKGSETILFLLLIKNTAIVYKRVYQNHSITLNKGHRKTPLKAERQVFPKYKNEQLILTGIELKH